MLTDLLEKQSAPPIIPSIQQSEKSETESATASIKINEDDNDEPEAKKPRVCKPFLLISPQTLIN